MKKILGIAALTLAVAGCAESVSTGRKSPCAGSFRKDGSYTIAPPTVARGAVVSRSTTSPGAMRLVAGGGDDCQFARL